MAVHGTLAESPPDRRRDPDDAVLHRGGLAYFLAGLALLYRILIRHFSARIVLATLVCITFGTNLFHYGVFDGTFSHAFSFLLVCAWLFASKRWWEEPTRTRSLVLGIVAALIVLTRHTNAIFLVVLPLDGVTSSSDLPTRITELWQRRQSLLVAVRAGVAAFLPQLTIYRWTMGSWLASPYGALDVGFSWDAPHVVDVLFSARTSIWVSTPPPDRFADQSNRRTVHPRRDDGRDSARRISGPSMIGDLRTALGDRPETVPLWDGVSQNNRTRALKYCRSITTLGV